jgi:hypothetical protein
MSENTATAAGFIVCLLYFIARIWLEIKRPKKATETHVCDFTTGAQKQATEEIKRNVGQMLKPDGAIPDGEHREA